MTIGMQQQKNNLIYSLSLFSAVVGQILILFGLPYDMSSMVSLGTVIIALSCILSFVYLIFFEKQNTSDGLFLILIFVWAMSFAVVLGGVSYANIVKIVAFIEFPLFLTVSSRVNNKSLKQFVYAIAILYALWFTFLYFQDFARTVNSDYGQREVNYLTLGYSNSNETAMYLYCDFVLLLSAIFYYKNNFAKIVSVIATLFVGWLIYETSCRGIFIIVLIITTIVLVFKVVKLTRPTFVIVAIIPILFFIITVLFDNRLTEIIIYGESFETGRFKLYKEYLDNLNIETLIFGDFLEYKLLNSHNGYLSVVATLGIFFFIVYFIVVLRLLLKIEGKCVSKSKIVLALGVLGIIIYSSIEAAVLVTGSAFAVISFMMSALLFCEDNE